MPKTHNFPIIVKTIDTESKIWTWQRCWKEVESRD